MSTFDWNSLPPPESIDWPVYPEASPARRDEECTEAFNEAAARHSFGVECVDALVAEQHHTRDEEEQFRGDWLMLAMLLRSAAHAQKIDPECNDKSRFAALRKATKSCREKGVYIHLEHADLSEAHLEHAFLWNAHLEHADLSEAHLEHASLWFAHLEHANLSEAHLEHADLSRAHLEHASLWFANLEHASLKWAQLEHASLKWAHLEHAILRDAHLEHADLRGAHLEHADLIEAYLEHANLRLAHLEHADLKWAQLEHADLDGANFDHANVRGAKGILFNDNEVMRLNIEGKAPDPWSVLRREYTGPRFFMHLLLTIAFLLPFAVSVFHLSAVDEAYRALTAIADGGRDTNGGAALPRTALREAVAKFEQTHVQTPAWWVLVGGTKGWSFIAMTAAVAAYNLLRVVLTIGIPIYAPGGVTALRESEERSVRTPSLKEYYGPLHPLTDTYKQHVLGWRQVVSEETHKEILVPPEKDHGKWRLLARKARWLTAYWLNPFARKLPQPDEEPRACNRFMDIGLYRLHRLATLLLALAATAFILRAALWLLQTTVPVHFNDLL
jgi:uncharacterized protein YjbI with pentapeptide repeats